jgi:hypothetical protein
MTEQQVNYEAHHGLYGFRKTVKDCLRSYLFMISVDDKDDVVEKTALIRNIKWSKDEITIDTLVDENIGNFHELLNMKKLKVCFLDRTGNRVLDDSFEIKTLKHKHPLEIGHDPAPGFVIYRLVFEY